MRNKYKKYDNDPLHTSGFFVSDEEISDQMNKACITEEAEAAKERIFSSVSAKLGFEEERKQKDFLIKRHWWSVAASVLVISGLGVLLYQLGFRSEPGEWVATSMEVSNPNESVLEFVLPDSTKVVLNSGTTLKYPSSFAQNQRTVELDGEAFFDVTKDSACPFVVHTRGMEIRVLGTRFNLKSFEKEPQIELTLEEGAVLARLGMDSEKQEVRLTPGDQVVLDKTTGEVTNRKVDTQQYTGWVDGTFFFNDNTLEEIARELEKKFHVTIDIKKERTRKERFYCQFDRDDSLETILRLLSHRSNWTYKITGDQIQIID